MYPRVKYQLADGHANGAADGIGTPAMHANEASRLATLATEAADRASPENAAAAASAAASAQAAAATAINAADGSAPAQRLVAAAKTSPKVKAGTLAGAIATLFWAIAAATFWKNTFDSGTLAILVASTTTILAAAGAYFTTDPLRSQP
jgi:hypothetical protein